MTSGLTTDELRSFLRSLGDVDEALDDADRIDRLRLFEELKAAAAAAQALEAVALDRSRRHAQATAGLPAKKQGAGVAAEVGLAMRMSPHRAQRWLGWAKIVTSELPLTFAELRAGRTTEWRAMLVARETIFLARDDRARVDLALARQLEGWGDKRVGDEARRAACRLDPRGAADRASNASRDRYVSIRPAPDTMCRLSALLPVAEGVAAYAALRRGADTASATGDARSRGQVMADLLVERVTGQSVAADVAVELELVITDQTLFDTGDGSDEPAHLVGYGPLPAGIARGLAIGRPAGTAPRWIRRLYARPATGDLIAMDSRRRTFTPAQTKFLRVRDQTCRTPYCGAPVRHSDHVQPHARGGRTTTANGQGLCESCNHAKQAPGWTSRAGPAGEIVSVVPTGHEYASHPADLPGGRHRVRPIGVVEIVWHQAA